jgi:hypothetical protein
MELSTFELLVKAIAPPLPLGNPAGPAVAAVARRVVQGYFLTISNLEDKDLTFKLEFVISKPNPVDPNRSLFKNAFVAVDIAGANAGPTLLGGPAATSFTTFFRLPAQQTASVELLPILTLAVLSNPTPLLEVRGYVKLTLPALFQGIGQGFVPQSATPVKVLVNPEIRGTFLPNTYPTTLTGDFDQINYPLEVASGKGLNEVVPEPGKPIIIGPILPDIVERLKAQIPSGLTEGVALEQAEELVGLMAQLDFSPENLRSFSDLLSKLEIPLQVSRC